MGQDNPKAISNSFSRVFDDDSQDSEQNSATQKPRATFDRIDSKPKSKMRRGAGRKTTGSMARKHLQSQFAPVTGQSLNLSLPVAPQKAEDIDIDEFNQSVIINTQSRPRRPNAYNYFREYRALRRDQSEYYEFHFSEVMNKQRSWLGVEKFHVIPELLAEKIAEKELVIVSDPLKLVWEKRTYRERVFVTPEEWNTEAGRHLARERFELYGLRFKYVKLGGIMEAELLRRLGARKITLTSPSEFAPLSRDSIAFEGEYLIEKAYDLEDLKELYVTFAKVCAMLYVFFPRLVRLLQDAEADPGQSLTLLGHTQMQTVGWFREIRKGELRHIFEATTLEDFGKGCGKFSELCKTHLMIGQQSLYDYSKPLRAQAVRCAERLFACDEFNRSSGKFRITK